MGNVVGVAGGFHGFSDLKKLKKLQMVVPTHCTQKIEEIKKLYPDKYIEGGAGCVIEMDS
jgi:7,8-dihydropterin-6-yl-methyl-4-(beta-D-ribofuranosyl)aminobenzene 5'-phosphate synthase